MSRPQSKEITVSVTGNPFQITTKRRRCGRGEIITDAYADGEIVAMTIRVPGGRHAIRTSEHAVLLTLLDHLGDVVAYDAFGAPQDSVRRDLGRLRHILEACDLDLDVVPNAGYRLRTSRTRIRTQQIGDVTLDADARRLTCRDRSVQIGATTADVLRTLAEADALHPEAIYTRAWGGVPHEIEDVVAARVGDLRRALEQVGSATRIMTLRLASRCYYALRTPDTARRHTQRPLRRLRTRTREPYDPGCYELFPALPWRQVSLFDPPPSLPVRRRRIVRDETTDMMPLFDLAKYATG
jgi:hypothetical protein